MKHKRKIYIYQFGLTEELYYQMQNHKKKKKGKLLCSKELPLYFAIFIHILNEGM